MRATSASCSAVSFTSESRTASALASQRATGGLRSDRIGLRAGVDDEPPN